MAAPGALLAALGWPKWCWEALGWLLAGPSGPQVVLGWPWPRPLVDPASPQPRGPRAPVRIHCIDILDARRGALKRPPSRASFRRTVVPSYRRSDVQKCRCAAIPMLRPKRRSKSEPEAEDFRRAEAQDLRATVQQLRTKPKATKPKGQDLTAKAQDHRAKEETELKPQS